jgi:ABC-type Fe3+-siderophore transport system permease subunit
MNRIKYAEQLYALISMCLGCAFIVFGLLSFIGILQPTSASIVQSQRHIGIVFSVLGVAFLIAQAIFTVLASAKRKSYCELISNGIKVMGL